MPNEYASMLICYSLLYLLFTGLQQYLSIVLLISNVIAIKIDLTTNSTITQHIIIVYRFICWYFNPRSHERSDEVLLLITATSLLNFNPRSHERSDTISLNVSWYFKNFNPRSHERSDLKRQSANDYLQISIHAPTRGATAILHKKFVYFYTIPTINI